MGFWIGLFPRGLWKIVVIVLFIPSKVFYMLPGNAFSGYVQNSDVESGILLERFIDFG